MLVLLVIAVLLVLLLFPPASTVSSTVTYLVASATLIAETVSTVELSTLGAVYKPDGLTEPSTAVQVILLLAVPTTCALSCSEAPLSTVAWLGTIVTFTSPVLIAAKLGYPLQLRRTIMKS